MCDHKPSNDPRLHGLCVKCGRPIPKAVDPTSAIDPARDTAFEADFLADALTMAARVAGIPNMAYATRVNHRLEIGRQRYGDGDFLSKDNLVEVMEETPDLAAYAMLELQRLRRDGSINPVLFNDLRLDLVAVAAYGSVADYFAQRAAQRLKENA